VVAVAVSFFAMACASALCPGYKNSVVANKKHHSKD